MFFIIVNIVLCAVMVATSFSIDRHGRVSNNNNSLVNIILVIASLFALMAGDVALCLWGPKQLHFCWEDLCMWLWAGSAFLYAIT